MAQKIRPDFSVWPNVTEWNLDDTLEYGMVRVTVDDRFSYQYSASCQTLEDLNKYRYRSGLIGVTVSPAKPVDEDVPSRMETKREFILDNAKALVTGDRNKQYGEPYDDFKKVSDALNAYGYRGPGGRDMMPRDVPFFQILVKLSRIVQSPTKDDSWIDAAGYAACGAEVAEVETTRDV